MAPTVYDFNVTIQDVLDRIPFGTSGIGANTQPIDNDDVTNAIEERASKMAGALERNGPKPSSLEDEAKVQIQAAIRDGAAAEIMATAGEVGDVYQERKAAWEAKLEEYRDSSNIDGQSGGRVDSNISDDDPESDFIGTDFEM